MLQELLRFDSSRFNSLPDIELADTEMRTGDKLSTALSALAPIFVEHDNRFGLPFLRLAQAQSQYYNQ